MTQPWPPPQQPPPGGGWNQGTGWGWPQSPTAGQRLAAGWQQQAVGSWQQQPGSAQQQPASQGWPPPASALQQPAPQASGGWRPAAQPQPLAAQPQPWGYPPPAQGFTGRPYGPPPVYRGGGGGGCLKGLLIAGALGITVLLVSLALLGIFLRTVTGAYPTASTRTSASARATATAITRTPSMTASARPPSPSASPTATVPTRTPSTSATPSATPIPGPSGVGKADTDPKPVPQPGTWTRASTLTKNNPLYKRTVKVPTRCGVGLIDPAAITASALKKHLDRMAGCLTMVWRPQVRAAGFTMPYPPVTVYTGDSTSPCGRMNAHNAFYCSGSQRIYFGTQLHEILPDRDYAYDLIMAHEYGHAVQARTGIFTSAFAYYYAATGEERRRIMRRVELQADCFAGAGMNALSRYTRLTASDRRGFAEIARAIADDTMTGKVLEHGSADARERWLKRGLGTASLKGCNTFTASNVNVR